MWMLFALIERPYYDRNGKVLKSIEGRHNRQGKDEFSGGGKFYPMELQKAVIHEWYEADELLVNAVSEIIPKDFDAVISYRKVKHGLKQAGIRKIKGRDFNVQKLNDQQADKWLKDHEMGPYNPYERL